MSKRTKIILIITGLVLMIIVFLSYIGVQSMSIEDYYGDHQNLYYQTEEGDIIVNRDLKEFRRLGKSWNRIYFVDKMDTTNLYNWFTNNKIEIYRPEQKMNSASSLTFDKIEQLIKEKEFRFIMKN